jgi:hypothetical protein
VSGGLTWVYLEEVMRFTFVSMCIEPQVVYLLLLFGTWKRWWTEGTLERQSHGADIVVGFQFLRQEAVSTLPILMAVQVQIVVAL